MTSSRAGPPVHEASIALDLVRAASEVAREHGGERVSRVGVRIGEWSSVVPGALAFAFPEAARGTLLEGAALDIERVPGVGECPRHGPVPLDLTRGLRCPACGAPTPHLLQGDELELDTLELGAKEPA